MKSILILIACAVLTGTAPVFAQNEVKEQLTVPLSDPGKPGSLDVGLLNGSIHVTGYNGKEVVIDAVSPTRQNKKSETAEGGMRRIPSGNPFDLSAEERNNRVRIEATTHHRPVNLTIKVPQRFSLKLSTVNQGDITVENVNGELEINNVNGPIQLTNVGGSAVANTINGGITAVFREVDGKAPMAFSTLNGRVDVTFPASARVSIKARSDRGDIYSDFDIDVEKNQPKTTRTSQSGMYRVSIEDWVYGKINGGGPEVMMKSMQGSIYVRKEK